jgi:hypothetical protein
MSLQNPLRNRSVKKSSMGRRNHEKEAFDVSKKFEGLGVLKQSPIQVLTKPNAA